MGTVSRGSAGRSIWRSTHPAAAPDCRCPSCGRSRRRLPRCWATPDALRDRVASAASGLLALLGVNVDPVRGREFILVSHVLDQAWRAGRDVDLGGLIRAIQAPPFAHIGVLDVDTFYPPKDRHALAMALNGLLASPSFAPWLEGEPLNIQNLLYTPAGQPRISILSVAHLSDTERMFFVTLVLNELLAWMRNQEGTPSLRALFYMDEIFGYFPPVANPPSKPPMLTLLKQARAYGLGLVLATQNPVDLDYRGLANCGTWFLGRLQTQQDKARVLDGLQGAAAEAGTGIDRAGLDRMLSDLAGRSFLMRNVHEDEPVVFQTRLGSVLSARAADARTDPPPDGRPDAGSRRRPRGRAMCSPTRGNRRPPPTLRQMVIYPRQCLEVILHAIGRGPGPLGSCTGPRCLAPRGCISCVPRIRWTTGNNGNCCIWPIASCPTSRGTSPWRPICRGKSDPHPTRTPNSTR